jgi:aryl-alcohol dehydrogenase-like predicted oxidoreductase
MTPTELSLKWCHSRWFVTSTIIGATSMEQLKENINVRKIFCSVIMIRELATFAQQHTSMHLLRAVSTDPNLQFR